MFQTRPATANRRKSNLNAPNDSTTRQPPSSDHPTNDRRPQLLPRAAISLHHPPPFFPPAPGIRKRIPAKPASRDKACPWRTRRGREFHERAASRIHLRAQNPPSRVRPLPYKFLKRRNVPQNSPAPRSDDPQRQPLPQVTPGRCSYATRNARNALPQQKSSIFRLKTRISPKSSSQARTTVPIGRGTMCARQPTPWLSSGFSASSAVESSPEARHTAHTAQQKATFSPRRAQNQATPAPLVFPPPSWTIAREDAADERSPRRVRTEVNRPCESSR